MTATATREHVCWNCNERFEPHRAEPRAVICDACSPFDRLDWDTARHVAASPREFDTVEKKAWTGAYALELLRLVHALGYEVYPNQSRSRCATLLRNPKHRCRGLNNAADLTPFEHGTACSGLPLTHSDNTLDRVILLRSPSTGRFALLSQPYRWKPDGVGRVVADPAPYNSGCVAVLYELDPLPVPPAPF